MSRSEGPSGPIPSQLHPFVMPTLFVVGGWLLLIGGYLPGQGGREGTTRSASPAPVAEYPYPYPHPGPALHPYPEPTQVTAGSGSGPIRLTIELPNGSGSPTAVVVDQADRLAAPDSDAAADPAATRASARSEEAPVYPPRIPGPPPEFDPTILSPMLPESVPAVASEAPILGGSPRTDRLIARPLDELPESFDPGAALNRFRDSGDESPTFPEADPAPTDDASSIADGRDDRAPIPPTAPIILPEPVPDHDDDQEDGSSPIPVRPDSEQRVFQPLQIEPNPDQVKPPRQGLRGLFRAFRPPPPIPDLPPPQPLFQPQPEPLSEPQPEPLSQPEPQPFPQPQPQPPSPSQPQPFHVREIPESAGAQSGPTAAPLVPSDVLVQTDSLFRSAQTSFPTPTPMPVPEPSAIGGLPQTPDPWPGRAPISEIPGPAESFESAPEAVPPMFSAPPPPPTPDPSPGRGPISEVPGPAVSFESVSEVAPPSIPAPTPPPTRPPISGPSRRDPRLVREIPLAVPGFDREVLRARSLEEDRAAGRGSDQEASIDPE